MIGKKLALQKTISVELSLGDMGDEEEILLEIPHLEKVKHLTLTNLRRYGHQGLVSLLRLHIRSKKLLKKKYESWKGEFKEKVIKNGVEVEKREISKFLKTMGDYKHKIKTLKNRIHEEEKDL